jgi:NarL family two-component system response regulator LiaR
MTTYPLLGQSLALMMSANSTDLEVEVCDIAKLETGETSGGYDVILLEAVKDLAGRLERIDQLKRSWPGVPMMVLGTENDEDAYFAVIEAGADGYLTPEMSEQALLRTVRGVARGELGLSRKAAHQMVMRLRATKTEQLLAGSSMASRNKLTTREREIFELVRKGLRSHEIAQQLFIADSTVYKHIQNILDKLNVRNRTQALIVSESSGK